MKIPIVRIPFSKQEIEEIQEAIGGVLKSNMLTKGPVVEQFEDEWANYCGVKYAIACTSGTAALEMIYQAIGVGGKSVVIPSNTFIGTATGIIRAGGKVILADCERDTLQLSLKSAIDACRDDTVAVVLVHIGGYISPHLNEFRYWTQREGMKLIEDCCQSHGAEFDGKKAGSLGDVGAFSFFATKIITTAEGGMVTTDNEEIYHKCISLRNQGRNANDGRIHDWLGYNWRMDEVRAVLGLQQVRKADAIVGERRKIAGWYNEKLWRAEPLSPEEEKLVSDVPVGHESSPEEIAAALSSISLFGLLGMQNTPCNPAYYKYVVLLAGGDKDAVVRDDVKLAMESKGIAMPGLVYDVPLHKQPAILESPSLIPYGGSLENSEWVTAHHLCLPIYLGLSEDEVDFVVESLKEILE